MSVTPRTSTSRARDRRSTYHTSPLSIVQYASPRLLPRRRSSVCDTPVSPGGTDCRTSTASQRRRSTGSPSGNRSHRSNGRGPTQDIRPRAIRRICGNSSMPTARTHRNRRLQASSLPSVSVRNFGMRIGSPPRPTRTCVKRSPECPDHFPASQRIGAESTRAGKSTATTRRSSILCAFTRRPPCHPVRGTPRSIRTRERTGAHRACAPSRDAPRSTANDPRGARGSSAMPD